MTEGTPITFETLGISQEELIERVVDRIYNNLMVEAGYPDYSDEEDQVPTDIAQRLTTAARKAVDAKVDEIGTKHLLPKVGEMVENLCLQETNRWGEAKGEKLTFTEYLVHRAESWISEKVDYKGVSKSEARDSSWRGDNTRIAFMIHKHLDYRIKEAMTEAFKQANASIAKGLHEAVRLQINEVVGRLKIDVKTTTGR